MTNILKYEMAKMVKHKAERTLMWLVRTRTWKFSRNVVSCRKFQRIGPDTEILWNETFSKQFK